MPVRLLPQPSSPTCLHIAQLRELVPGLLLHAIGPDAADSPAQAVTQPGTEGAREAAGAASEAVLHLSLSRTLPIQSHLVASLLQELKEGLSQITP